LQEREQSQPIFPLGCSKNTFENQMPNQILFILHNEVNQSPSLKKSTRSEFDIKVDESKISQTEWKCQDCGRIFGRRDKLKDHYRLRHMDDRPYACPQCPKTFTQKTILKRHVKKQH
jgi:uncharacterized Zn-finger protein